MLALNSSLRSLARLPAGYTAVRAYATQSGSHAKGDTRNYAEWTQKLSAVGDVYAAQVARKRGFRDAVRVCHQDTRWTNVEADSVVGAFAEGILDNRIRTGSNISLLVVPDSEGITAIFGPTKAGVTSNVIQPDTEENVLKDLLLEQKPRGAVIKPKYRGVDVADRFWQIMDFRGEGLGSHVRSKLLPDFKTAIHTNQEHKQLAQSFMDTLVYDPLPSKVQSTRTSRDTPAFAFVANGKTVSFTNGQVLEAGENLAESLGLYEDRVLVTLPSWQTAFSAAGVACAVSTSLIILPDYDFKADTSVRELARERASVLYSSPSHLRSMLESPRISREDLSALRAVVIVNSEGDVADQALVKQVQNGFEVAEVHSALSCQTTAAPFLVAKASETSASGFVGRPVTNTEVKIGDDSGKAVGHNTAGIIFTKGSHAAASKDGWHNTGVKAQMDASGNVTLA